MAIPARGESKKTTYEALTDLLRQEIISGRLPGGSRVTIAEVADRYGVSQMPVREALQRLQGEGLVVLLAHRGASVLALDAQFVRNIYDLRGAIESLLAQLSLPNLTLGTVARLADICARLDAAAKAGDQQSVRHLNGEFHSLLYQHAHNPTALAIYDRYSGLIGALRNKYGVGPGRLPEIGAELAEALEAVRTQDAERLGRLVQRACELAKQDLLRLMDQAQ